MVLRGSQDKENSIMNAAFIRKLFQLYQPYRQQLNNLIGVFAMSIEPGWIADFLERTQRLRDPYENHHGRTVAILAEKMAREDHSTDDEVKHIVLGARLHDVGKILLPESVLNKPGRLTYQESIMVRAHPQQGIALLEPFNLHADIIDIVHHHHENLDGTGYPDGLRGKQIKKGVRIVRLCDSLESMTRERSYKQPMDVMLALDKLQKEIGTKYDPLLFELMARIIRRDGYEATGDLNGHTTT